MIIIMWYTSFLIFSIVISNYICHWVIAWILLELSSLSLIPIFCMGATPRAVEASTKYFIFQAVASIILLLGIYIRFMEVGTFNISGASSVVSSFLLLVALIIKLGLFPSHFWFVDVMSGLGFVQCFYVAVASKILPLLFLIESSVGCNSKLFLLIGGVSILVGSNLGTSQVQIRKILALSSIAHLGWLIVIIPYSSSIVVWFLFVCYVFMLSSVVVACNILAYTSIKNKANIGLGNIFVIVNLLSLAAFPPTLGFFYKLVIFFLTIENNNYLVCGVLVVGGLISLFFYVNIVFSIYCVNWPQSKGVFGNVFVLSKELFNLISLVSVQAVLLFVGYMGSISGILEIYVSWLSNKHWFVNPTTGESASPYNNGI